jgi:hypothetical protein
MSKATDDKIPDDDDTADTPLTMAASVILTNLPKDASQALESVGSTLPAKGMKMSVSFAVTRQPHTDTTVTYFSILCFSP